MFVFLIGANHFGRSGWIHLYRREGAFSRLVTYGRDPDEVEEFKLDETNVVDLAAVYEKPFRLNELADWEEAAAPTHHTLGTDGLAKLLQGEDKSRSSSSRFASLVRNGDGFRKERHAIHRSPLWDHRGDQSICQPGRTG